MHLQAIKALSAKIFKNIRDLVRMMKHIKTMRKQWRDYENAV